MNALPRVGVSSLAVSLLVPLVGTVALAAGTYHDSLVAGDRALTAGKADEALREYDAAVTHAASAGERALAGGKRGYVLAYLKDDYAAAREAASEGLAVEGLEPVARVTLLQVLACCQMRGEKDFSGAMVHLEEALKLEGVEWAKPGLLLALGDCQRELGEMEDALASYAKILTLPYADAGSRAGAHLCSGFIHQYDRRDATAARACYAKALELRPDLKDEIEGHLGRLP